MSRYLGRRLWQMVPILLGVSLGVFAFLHAVPGDPARLLAGPDATLADIQAVRARLGLDRPLVVQFIFFLRNALVGDFGRSYRSGELVASIVARHFGPTLVLSVASIAFATIAGMGIGLLQAVWRNTLPDYVSTVVSVTGISTPPFFLGLLLIYLLAVDVHWFPTGGIGSMRNLVLPAITLGAGAAATIARFARSSLLEVLGEEYVRTARAKGLKEGPVLMKHALRNALIPVVTMIGLQFGFLLSGAIVVETVFSWPGLGWLMIQSISFRDYPVLVAEILLLSLQFLVINLVVDILYAVLDPRVGYG